MSEQIHGEWQWSEDGEPSLAIMPGFVVTPLRDSDAQAWLEMEPEWVDAPLEEKPDIETREIDIVKRNVERGKPFIAAFRDRQEVKGTPIWMARDVANGGKGVCRLNFNNVPGLPADTKNLGWSTHPDYRRRGLAKATVTSVLEHFGATQMGLKAVVAECRYDNLGSIGVMRSAGFEKIGESPATVDDYRVELRGDGLIYEYRKVLVPRIGVGAAA